MFHLYFRFRVLSFLFMTDINLFVRWLCIKAFAPTLQMPIMCLVAYFPHKDPLFFEIPCVCCHSYFWFYQNITQKDLTSDYNLKHDLYFYLSPFQQLKGTEDKCTWTWGKTAHWVITNKVPVEMFLNDSHPEDTIS